MQSSTSEGLLSKIEEPIRSVAKFNLVSLMAQQIMKKHFSSRRETVWRILLPAALRAAQACRYLIYSQADYELHRWGLNLVLHARFSQNLQCLYLISGALGVKILLDLLRGLSSYGGFKLRGSGCPKFSAPPSGETMRQTRKRCLLYTSPSPRD